MELTPQALQAVEFREARKGGYNTRDVDDFIERVAGGVGQLHERVREAHARAEAAEARLMDTQRELDEARRRPMSPEAAETDETLRRTLVLAQRTADATIKEAKEEANRVLSEAREEAARTRAEAEADARRGAEGARMAAQAEVETLISNRDALKGDVETLTKRLGEQRNNIRAGVNELQRLLDDPTALKPVPTPQLADIERPAPFDAPVAAAAASAAPANGDTESNGVAAAAADGNGNFGPGQQVGAIQEPPMPDLGPPTQPVPFALSGDNRGPWLPSELRPSDEPLGPLPPPPAASPPAPSTPADRPDDWDRAILDPHRAEQADSDNTRFGRPR
jgi:DivIVA domain-containing protein